MRILESGKSHFALKIDDDGLLADEGTNLTVRANIDDPPTTDGNSLSNTASTEIVNVVVASTVKSYSGLCSE